jgi:Yip1-like protein
MNLVQRAQAILLAPRTEWPTIATEPATVQSIYTGWVMILAAIGPIMIILSSALFGGFFGFGVRAALAAYINSLIAVALLALVIDVLAPSFGGTKDYVRSLKLVAYSFTAAWVAQIALIVPVLGWLVVLLAMLYGFYLFFIGAPLLGRCSVDKAVPFTVVVILCAVVLGIIIQRVVFGLIGFGVGAPGSMGLVR